MEEDNYQSVSLLGHKYYIAESLGEGTFGSVRTCYNEEGHQFAVKEFQFEKVDSDDSDLDSSYSYSHYESLQLGTLREISVLRLFSPLYPSEMGNVKGKDYYIMSLEDVTQITGATCMIMPKQMCSLKKAITSNLLNNKQKLNVSHKLLIAVAFLHENFVIHRDIKTDNILLDDDFNPVLADFSLSKLFDRNLKGSTHTPGLGTATYKAPEIYREEDYDLSSDVFSLGIVFFELFNGMIKLDRDKAALNYIEDMLKKLGDKPLPSLLKQMLNFTPQNRITCMDALKLPLFEKLPTPNIAKVHNKIIHLGGDTNDNNQSGSRKDKKKETSSQKTNSEKRHDRFNRYRCSMRYTRI
jgi:serine/threonine protein kinase